LFETLIIEGAIIKGGNEMKCPNCQHENPDTQKFCGQCGAKLDKLCPSCGISNPPQYNFCGGCGHSLAEPKEAPPIDFSEPQSYTPRHLADKILTTRSSIEGERKLVTVLFADVTNYTAISEKLDPEEVHQIMDGCFKILINEIHKYEGAINQFTGDGVMALFGAPVAHEDHAHRSCYAALSIQKAMEEYGDKIGKETGIEFKMRIGLNSGPVIVGAIGDDLRMDYTAVGDTTNQGSRMESMARPGTILVSGNTHRLVRDFFEFESLGKIEVKGKRKPQEAFELIKAGEVETRIGASVAKGLTRFVGRKNSMAALMEPFEKVKSGSGQVVGLVGEAGVGKSRLLLEMRNKLPRGEYNYSEGRCLHFGGSMAYLPILDILKSYFEIKEGDREFIIKKKMEEKILALDEKLKDSIPPFQALLSLKVGDEEFIKLEPREKRDRTFEALRDLMIRGSEDKPLVIAVEDVHWIDKTSEEFIDYVIEWLANCRILLILLYRPEYTHQWGSKSYYNKIGLNQLGTQSSTELIKAILEKGEVVPELRQLILNRAAGNPLFLEEFTHTLLENGSIEKKDEKYVLGRKVSDIQVPDTIQGIISARMDRLEDNLKRTMQVASVIGRDFAFRILQTITGMREELKSYLLNLQGLEFIYEKRLFPELEYIFKHALIQEVAYNSLLVKRRSEIHQSIGEAIETLYADRLEEFYEMLAYHYAKAESPEKAYKYLKLSAAKATQSHIVADAFGFYKDAVEILKQMPDSEENKREMIKLIILMDTPMRLLAYREECLPFLKEGEKAAKDLGDEKSLATFYSLMGFYYTFRGDPLRSLAYNENCIKVAHKVQDIDLIAPAALGLCLSYEVSGDYLKIVDLAPGVINLLEKTKKESNFFGQSFHPYSVIQAYYGLALANLDRLEEGKALLEKGLAFSHRINHLATQSFTEATYGSYYAHVGDAEEAIKHFREVIRYAEKGNIDFMLGFGYLFLGWAYLLQEEPESGRKHMEKGLRIATDAGAALNSSLYPLMLGYVHFELGNLKESEKYMKECCELSQVINAKHYYAQAKMWLGRIWSRKGVSKRHQAEECILEGIKMLEGLGLKLQALMGYLFLGELYADSSQKEKALENLKRAEQAYQKMGMHYWATRTQEVLDRL
jgi:class 3 adenylate cyclase/tetratricopeptide (TPR) repeat protein